MDEPLYETHSDVTPDVPTELAVLADFKPTPPQPIESKEVAHLKHSLRLARRDREYLKAKNRRLKAKLDRIEGIIHGQTIQNS